MFHPPAIQSTDELLPIPSWMLPAGIATANDIARIKRENERTMFAASFDRMMEIVATGQPLRAALETDSREIDYQRFLAWVHKDDARLQRYYEAQSIGGEVVAQQMLDIADASDTFEDVQRSTLRINTRKWLLGVWNRKRFGDVKQIDQTVTIDMVGAMEEARQRAARRQDVIDVTPR